MNNSILKQRESLDVKMRHFHSRDIPSIMDTESATPKPWDEKTVSNYIRDRHQIVKVAELPDRHYVVGHLCVRITKHQLRIDKIAVKPGFRTQGVREKLLLESLEIGKRLKLPVAFPIRETDLPSQLWLRARGWFCYRIAKDYFITEQAYWFAPNDKE